MARRVVIVGGGSGGTILANSLDPRSFEVTVVSASLAHMFQPALLYVAFRNAKPDMVRDERTLLASHVRIVHEAVDRVDLLGRRVHTSSGEEIAYDDVVLATGILTDPGQIPGLADTDAEFGDYHSNIAQAQKLWKSLDAFRGGTIVLGQASPVCKCPPSPLEGVLLTEELIAKRGLRDKTRIVFFTPYPRAYPARPMNEIVEPILAERGIEVMPFFDLDRIDPATRTIFSIEGEQVRYDLPIIIPPFIGADIAYEPASVLDQSRLVITDRESLRVKGVEHAYAIGDGTNLPTSKSGVGAHLEAKAVASALAGRPVKFEGRTHCPFDMAHGRGTFVIGSYTAPVVKYPPTRWKHFMKVMFGRLYWLELRGRLDPVIDLYFKLTEPKPAPIPK
jgi:sulfide:quinone oxidoreductase